MAPLFGLLLGLLSGVMTGSFSLPMKKTTRWSWEATWLIWSICALLIIPWVIAFATVTDVLSVFTDAKASDMFLVYVFGLCWGLGAVFFGQSIAMIGISLSFALCIGLATALGQVIPMLKNPQVFQTAGGMWSTVGIVVMVLGVAVCAIAGHFKGAQASDIAQIEDGFLITTFRTGKVYLSYQGAMEAPNGDLLVLDQPYCNEYYEYALKQRILENMIWQGESVSQQLGLVETRLRAARNNALSFVNTPNFQEMQKVWTMNRRAQYHNYYNMFLSYAPVNPRVAPLGGTLSSGSNKSSSVTPSC